MAERIISGAPKAATPKAATPRSVQGARLDQASAVADRMASLASNAESLLHEAIVASGHPEAAVFTQAAQQLVQQIGLLADFLNQKVCGSPGVIGGVPEWLLPSGYLDAEARAVA